MNKTNFGALSHKNFRYFWTGQCISLMGTWMQRTAQQWLVYTLTNSPFLLGLLGVFQFMPMLLFSLFAGAFVDRFSKKKLLILAQTAFMIQAFILWGLAYSGVIRYWHILILALFMGFTNTLDMPTRQSFMTELVGKEDLVNAIALNSTIVNLARIIGPAVAGIIMVKLGTTACFLINGISFIPVIYGILKIKTKPVNIKKKNGHLIEDILDGLKYIASKNTLISAVLSMLVVGTFAMNADIIIPVLARQVLHKQAGGYSVLLSAMGVGSFIGALLVVARSKKKPTIKMLFGSAIFIAVFSMLAIFIRSYVMSLLIIGIIGFFNIRFLTTVNSTIQLNSSSEYRGRAMSIYSLVFMGTTPVGNLFAGGITEKFGPNIGFFMCGMVTVILIIPVIILNKKRLSII